MNLPGALGELLLFGMARDLAHDEALEHVRRQPYGAAGGRAVLDPDASFLDDDSRIGIDVTAVDYAPKKRFFAISDNKHTQLRGQCRGYLGLNLSAVCSICVSHSHHPLR